MRKVRMRKTSIIVHGVTHDVNGPHCIKLLLWCLVCQSLLFNARYLSSDYPDFKLTYHTARSNTTRENSNQATSNNNAGDNHSIDPDATFSACLLWKDDNHRLEEWLAYHHFVMNLRYVVMTIDVKSRTSPKAIIDRWNQHESANMTIVVLNETQYVRDYDREMQIINKKKSKVEKSDAKVEYHRYRQREFYRACSEHLVEQKRRWTSYHDIDEFISFDWEVGGKNITHIGQSKLQEPGYVVYKLNAIRDQFLSNNGTGLSCLMLTRRNYCSREMSLKEIRDLSRSVVPEGFGTEPSDVVKKLDSLRYKYLCPAKIRPKSLIDLGQSNTIQFVNKTLNVITDQKEYGWGIHSVMQQICHNEAANRIKDAKHILSDEHLQINHYIGSWESYSFRDDARDGFLRGYETWEKLSKGSNGEYSHVIRPWLRGFAQSVGVDNAAYLLQDSGRFPEG